MKPETGLLLALLRSASDRQLITFEELTECIGADIHKHRSNLSSAIRYVAREGKIFTSCPRVGYQLASIKDIAKIAEQRGLSRTKSALKDWGQTLDVVPYEQLDTVGKRSYEQASTKLAVITIATSDDFNNTVFDRVPKMRRFRPSKEEIMAALATGVS